MFGTLSFDRHLVLLFYSEIGGQPSQQFPRLNPHQSRDQEAIMPSAPPSPAAAHAACVWRMGRDMLSWGRYSWREGKKRGEEI